MFVIVSYDIQDDRRRAKIMKTLKDYGQWVQYSVFECDLEEADYLKMRARLEKLIEPGIGQAVVQHLPEVVGSRGGHVVG